MSDEQSIRDEIADELAEYLASVFVGYNPSYVSEVADEVLASSAIRRIQAEAWDAGFDEASDDLGRAQMMRDLGESNNPYIEQNSEGKS